ncbi:MAG TPA: hypothetical protein VMV49_03390 [Candidatus Deferrimicrobium sp.]|nr:hypothetical protein [Candidatus Deferrimicrobium sp.]
MLRKIDWYYFIAIISVVTFFGAFMIPQITKLLFYYSLPFWGIIIITCILLPLFALFLLWLIIVEIQNHFRTEDFSKPGQIQPELIEDVFTEDDNKFIEAKMREQLDKSQFEDEELFEMHQDMVFSYVTNRAKSVKKILLADITKELELPTGVVKDIILILIADDLIDGLIENEILILD